MNGSSSAGTTITAKCNDNSILTNNQSTAQHADTLLSGLLNMLTPWSVESFHKVLTPYLISSERAAWCTGIWTKKSTAKSSDPLTHASFPQSNDALTNKSIVHWDLDCKTTEEGQRKTNTHKEQWKGAVTSWPWTFHRHAACSCLFQQWSCVGPRMVVTCSSSWTGPTSSGAQDPVARRQTVSKVLDFMTWVNSH